MRVTFPRLPDHDRAYALVERDDGATYRLYGGLAGPRLPHDIRHLVVERELAISDGIWGGIASGIVFGHAARQWPASLPSAERSRQLLAAFRDHGLRAEALANLVEGRGPCSTIRPRGQIQAARRGQAVRVLPEAGVDPAAIAATGPALQVEAARWARLRVGQEISYDWPRTALAALGPAARGTDRSAH